MNLLIIENSTFTLYVRCTYFRIHIKVFSFSCYYDFILNDEWSAIYFDLKIEIHIYFLEKMYMNIVFV